MTIASIIRRIYRKIVDKGGSDTKIKYLRKKGMIIGENCHFDTLSFSDEPYLIEIGNHVGISFGSVFLTHDAGIRCFNEDFPDFDVFGRIKIGDNVFIGVNCTILPNTIVGDNCIIGAGSVVRGRFPDNSVIIGNPARVYMKMSAQKFMYSQAPGLLYTGKMTDEQKMPLVKKLFDIG